MTCLRFEDYILPAAARGEDSALPDIHVNSYIRAEIRTSERITGEDARYIGKGMISTLLPYRIADGYDRSRTPRAMRAAVLENDAMRAVFPGRLRRLDRVVPPVSRSLTLTGEPLMRFR